MSTQSRAVSPLDYTLPIPPSETSAPSRIDWNGRLVVKAGNGCSDWLSKIPNTIRGFFIHAYYDARMYFRAFTSMGKETTPSGIDRRINEVTQFLTVIENNTNSAVTSWDFNGVKNRYQRLSPQVRDLFFIVDQNYINHFSVDQTIGSPQAMREEMIRECNRVVSFQRQLTAVNTFYRLFTGKVVIPPVSIPETPPLSDDGMVVDVTTTTTTTTHPLNLNVPGTVPYVQNAIPADVQGKADEINRLSVQFAALRSPPVVPTIFNNVIMSEDFMAIPVFDASHPQVQERLRAANASGATTAVRDALEERTIRHPYDKDALEAQIRAGTTWAPAKCYICRHPADGGIRRQYLRIDTGLQDQILQFLRNAVATGASTTP